MNYCPQCGRKILDQSLGCPICNVNTNETGATSNAGPSMGSGMSMPNDPFGSMPSYAPPSNSGLFQEQDKKQDDSQGFGQGYQRDYNQEENNPKEDNQADINQDLVPYGMSADMSIEEQFQQRLKKNNGNNRDTSGASYNTSQTTYTAPNTDVENKELPVLARVLLILVTIIGYRGGQIIGIVCGIILLKSQYPSYRSFGKKLLIIGIVMFILSFLMLFVFRILFHMGYYFGG